MRSSESSCALAQAPAASSFPLRAAGLHYKGGPTPCGRRMLQRIYDHQQLVGGNLMFGLMRCAGCPQTPEQKHYRRLHYCGTCRIIGRLYGRKARILLNNDAVFLGEVLSAISSAEENIDRWSRSHRWRNCTSLAGEHEEIPLSLQFAATAALIVAEFKLADQIADSRCSLWKLPYRFYSKSFRAASMRLERWDFPLAALRHCSRTQAAREAGMETGNRSQSVGSLLEYLSEPTASATCLFFRHGTRIVHRPDAEEAMAALGRAFGALVYLLDALEDYEKDFHRKNFNAVRTAFSLSGEKLPSTHREEVVRYLWEIAGEIESGFQRLPIPAMKAEHFSSRLKANLSQRLAGRPQAMSHACGMASSPAMTFRVRSRKAVLTGKTVTHNHLKARPGVSGRLQAPLVFLAAAVPAFAFPAQARPANTSGTCLEFPSFNAMLPGLVPGSPGSAGFSPLLFSELPSSPGFPEDGLNGEELGGEPGEKKKGSRCCSGWGDCGYWDCDCCECSGCDSCSCDCCDSCNCDC